MFGGRTRNRKLRETQPPKNSILSLSIAGLLTGVWKRRTRWYTHSGCSHPTCIRGYKTREGASRLQCSTFSRHVYRLPRTEPSSSSHKRPFLPIGTLRRSCRPFCITKPRDRWICTPDRRMEIVLLIANMLPFNSPHRTCFRSRLMYLQTLCV